MPSIEGGGVEKNLFLISNFLATKFKDLRLITASHEFKKKFKNINIIFPGFDLSSKSRIVKYFFCLYELLKIILKEKNLIIFSFQANLYCILISKLFRKKVIIRSNSSPSGWSNNYIKKKIFKTILKLADTIIVNSNEFQKEIKKKFSVRSVVIYNPLNKQEIIRQANKKVNFPFFDKTKKSLKIINIGRFTDQKDHLTLLKSVNEIKNKIKFKLLIIGRGINLNKINFFIKNNNLENFVKIINFKKNPFPYLKKADLFVLTSVFEGLPNVLLESATLKKFIISTNCPTGPKEILKNGRLGILCKIKDHKNISKEIIRYHKNKKSLDKIKVKTYNSLHRFDFNQNLKKYFFEINKYL